MAPLTPYTYIQCPCFESQPGGEDEDVSPADEEGGLDDDRTFDPRAPRANYSLYPLEYLMYCEDCHQMRCPRCVNEEIVTYYCPSCLFEVPSSNLKSEGNRCTRSCFQCPICVGPLAVTSLDTTQDPGLLGVENGTPSSGSSYVLACSYCQWSSVEVGIKFDKPNGIFQQLSKMQNGGKPRLTTKEYREQYKDRKRGSGNAAEPTLRGEDVDRELQFSQLRNFYQEQMADSNSQGAGLSSVIGGDLGFASPGSLSRIMSLYTGSHGGTKQSRNKIPVMREAIDIHEGLKTADLNDTSRIEQLRESDFDDTISIEQAAAQVPSNLPARFTSELRPIPYLLRTKRSKRCPLCRHIISKPESKISNTRFRIRLVAGSYIPSIAIRPLHSESQNVPSAQRPPLPQELWLSPLKPTQYLLTFKNPIFEKVKVTLATPAKTPGRFASTVTLMCPQFEINANTDMWDDALNEDGEVRKRKGEDGSLPPPEPGKIWERGRNWVSVVVEVVPASLRLDLLPAPAAAAEGQRQEVVDRSPLKEDEDVLEIPMFVRIEWESEARDDVGSAPGKDKDAKEKRELAYWCVLGMGRISQA